MNCRLLRKLFFLNRVVATLVVDGPRMGSRSSPGPSSRFSLLDFFVTALPEPSKSVGESSSSSSFPIVSAVVTLTTELFKELVGSSSSVTRLRRCCVPPKLYSIRWISFETRALFWFVKRKTSWNYEWSCYFMAGSSVFWNKAATLPRP